MTIEVEHSNFQTNLRRERFYSPDILPLLQEVLADLADIDFAHEKRLDAIRDSDADEAGKSEMVASLRRQHRERRAPYVQRLVILQDQIEATFA